MSRDRAGRVCWRRSAAEQAAADGFPGAEPSGAPPDEASRAASAHCRGGRPAVATPTCGGYLSQAHSPLSEISKFRFMSAPEDLLRLGR